MRQNTSRTMLGVTLLEVMLVLAIAAMIIVLSIRYYQSATASQQVNATLEQIQAITAAADSLSQGSGTYVGNATTANITSVLGGTSAMTTTWGTAITIGTATATSYPVTISNMSPQVCTQLRTRLAVNKNITGVTASCGTAPADFTYTYNSVQQS